MRLTANHLHQIASAQVNNPALEPPAYEKFAEALNYLLPKYSLEPLELAHFLGQAMHETGGFRWLAELGNASYFADRDNRPEYGHTAKGSGSDYRGRGLLQLTWKTNYEGASERLGVDFVANPQAVATPFYGVLTALDYWRKRNIKTLAMADDVRAVTKAINGGERGLAEREIYTARAKLILATKAEPNIAALEVDLTETEIITINQCLAYLKSGVRMPQDELYITIGKLARQ